MLLKSKPKPELWSPKPDALHQTLHIHFPELYRIASSNGSAWFSLWRGNSRARGIDVLSRKIGITERTRRISIDVVGNGILWKKVSKPHDLKLGIAANKDDHPVLFLPLPVVPLGLTATIQCLVPLAIVKGGF